MNEKAPPLLQRGEVALQTGELLRGLGRTRFVQPSGVGIRGTAQWRTGVRAPYHVRPATVRKRTDRNHKEIMATFRELGCDVVDTSEVGGGFPDLVVGCCGATLLVETKDGTKSPSKRCLTPQQVEFHAHWRGHPPVVVMCIEDVADLVGRVRRESY